MTSSHLKCVDAKKLSTTIQNLMRDRGWAWARGVMNRCLADIKRLIDLQGKAQAVSVRWPPLNAAYKARKIREGKDPRMLIATGDYRDSIELTETREGAKGAVTDIAIAPPDREHKDGKINMRHLARILEYGSAKAHIPPRPHWRPMAERYRQVLSEEGANAIKELNKEIVKDVARLKKMEKKGGKV